MPLSLRPSPSWKCHNNTTYLCSFDDVPISAGVVASFLRCGCPKRYQTCKNKTATQTAGFCVYSSVASMWFQKWRPNNSDSEKATKGNIFCKMEDKRSRLAVGSCPMWFPYPEGWRLLRNYGGWRWGIGGRLRSVHQLHHCECYACPSWLWQHRGWLNFRFAKFEGILFRWPATHLLFPWNRKGRGEHLRVDVGRGPSAQRHATCLWLELPCLSDWLGSTLYVVQREVRGHGQLCCLNYLPHFFHQTQMFLKDFFLWPF